MKKTLLLLASVALLLVGCQKEKFAEEQVGEMTKATFTACVDGGVATRASADNDGNGAKVNRCIMEIYFQDQLYTRREAAMSGNPATVTFVNVPVVAGKEYQVLFWADCGTSLSDKYYATDAGLKTVTVKKDAFITALNSKKNDELDAFFGAGDYTVGQTTNNSFNITLHRPFAQLNVITTDLGAGKTVTCADLLPEKVSVSYKAADKFNVATGEISSSVAGGYTYSYEAPVYGTWSSTKTELTLSMDYILASTEQELVNVTFVTKNGGLAVMTHSLSNLPYKRNYRTNVKGDLLTTAGSWTATIAPAWTTPAYDVPFYVATSIQDAQDYIAPDSQGTVKAKSVDLTKATISQDNVGSDGKIQFMLKETSPEDLVNFTLPSIPSTIQNCTGWKIENEPAYPTQNVGVNAPAGTKVVIDAPKSHVTVTGSSYDEIEASTGDNTLVIPQGVSVTHLKITKGAVEIHGTVTSLSVNPAEIAGSNPVQYEKVVFRECEGLSADVFKKIYSEEEPVCNYIDPWYTYEQVEGGKYNIYKRPVVAMIGEKEYKSLSDAVAAVPANNTDLVTIKVMSDVVINADALAINKNNVVLDGQGHTIAIDETDTRLNNYLVDGSSKKYGSFQMIKVSGNDVTLKNMTLDCNNYRGVSLATTCGGKNASYENIIYKGKGSGHYYGSAANEGTLTFKDCTFETHGYAIHTGNGAPDLVITNCDINGWVSYGSSTKSATITNCHFFSAEDQYNGTLATIRPYCNSTITGCTFSKEFLEKTHYTGITVRDAATVEFKGCLVDNGEIVDMANYTVLDPSDPWKDGGVMAIDATGNATDGFSAGTFVAKQASDIKAAQGFRIVAVEGKTNVWTTAPVEYKTTLLRGNEVFGQYETIAGAVKAFNFDENITAGDYTLNIKPGTYNEDMILFIQDKTEGKYRTLLVQSADPNQKVLVKSTSGNGAVFGIAAESDYSGGPISFKNIDFDVTENTNSETCVICFAGSQSGKPDEIFPEPTTNFNRRYAHDVSFDNCNIIGNGSSKAFRAPNGSSAGAIKVENCEITNCVYGFDTYIVAQDAKLEYGLHVKNVRFDGGVFINNQSAGASEISVEGCVIKCNKDYAIRTSGSAYLLQKFTHQFIIKNTTIEVDGAELDKDAGVIYFRKSETHASIENCIVTKNNITCKDNGSFNLYDIYNNGTSVTINGKTLPSGPGVGMEWLTATE